MSHTASSNPNVQPDAVLTEIAKYTASYKIHSDEAYTTARYCVLDALGCGLLALRYPECVKHLGPLVDGTKVENGAKVPGTNYALDPVQAAFNIGTLVRWLDFNDTWLAAEWGHPSDNLGAILAVADYLGRTRRTNGLKPPVMRDVFTAMIKAYEIQGVLALQNSYNRAGLDHVLLVRVASTAVATQMLGGSEEDIQNAVSQAWIDGGALRTYRHSPNTGSRKSWAAGDATSRAVRLALITMKGEMGYPTALSAPTWGFYDVLFKGKPFELARPFRSYVMENILFKISFPAEFHAQTAVECAVKLYPSVAGKLEDIERVEITTHESAIRIIDKKGPLNNPADRDHCLQYMTAIVLIYGDLDTEHYEDYFAADPRIDTLREKMVVTEDKRYSADYLDPEKRSIANAVQIFFKNGETTPKVEVEYPIGHRRRREEGIPQLLNKFEENLRTQMTERKIRAILEACSDVQTLDAMPVPDFSDLFAL